MALRNPVLFATINSHDPSLSFCHAGRDICESGYCYGPAIREVYLIHLVTSGKGTYVARGNIYHIHEGQAFIIYPQEITTYTADETDPWQYSFFACKGEMVERLLKRTSFADGNMVITLNDMKLSDLIIETAQTILSKPFRNIDMYATIQLLRMFEILMDHVDTPETENTLTKEYVQKAISYIQFNYNSHLTVSGLADMISINRSYFYRLFKKEVGISPNEYLNNYRVDLAKKLLITSDLSISQIAMATGFSTFSSFYRLFSLKYECSPREYRFRYRNEKEVCPGSM